MFKHWITGIDYGDGFPEKPQFGNQNCTTDATPAMERLKDYATETDPVQRNIKLANLLLSMATK